MYEKILELYFHKYLLYKNTTIIILFTYIIAMLVPFLIGQLKLTNLKDMLLVAIISLVVFIFIILLLKEFNHHLQRIPEELKKI